MTQFSLFNLLIWIHISRERGHRILTIEVRRREKECKPGSRKFKRLVKKISKWNIPRSETGSILLVQLIKMIREEYDLSLVISRNLALAVKERIDKSEKIILDVMDEVVKNNVKER